MEFEGGIYEIHKRGIIPDLAEVPEALRDVLRNCFLSDPLKRAQIYDIIDAIKKCAQV